MYHNWIVQQAKQSDPTKDIIIIENPETKTYLDKLLLVELWPPIKKHLETVGFPYTPEHSPKIETKLSYELKRFFPIIILGFTNRAMCKVILECGKNSWMIKTEFFLGLPYNTEPGLINEIIGNSRFEGNPPSMMIYKRYPESYFDITFNNGRGESWGMHDYNYIIDRVQQVIDVNISMYEQTVDGILHEGHVSEFLSLAFNIYESF